MDKFQSEISGLFCDDIIEFTNIPHKDALATLSAFKNFRVRYDSDCERGYLQTYNIREGLILRIFDIQIREDCRSDCKYQGEYFNLFFTLKDQHLSIGENVDELLHVEYTCAISYHTNNEMFEDFSRKGTRYNAISILIKKNLLKAEFFNSAYEYMPSVLRPLFTKETSKLRHSLPISPDINQALHMLMGSNYTGMLRDRFIEAKVMELICLVIKSLKQQNQEVSLRKIETRQTEMLEQARTWLVEDLSSPPSIDELARKVGLGKAALLDMFKQVYGVTLRHYLLQIRMNKAKILLEDNNLHVNQIAWQLGYGYACNFATAFKGYYGLTPNVYRKCAAITSNAK